MPDKEEMSFERISQAYREEKKHARLMKIEDSFYADILRFLDQLSQELIVEEEKNPASSKATLLRDEIKRVKRKFDQIYGFRERKILLLAWAKVSGGRSDVKNLTKTERQFFESLVDELKHYRGLHLEGRQLPDTKERKAPEADGEPRPVQEPPDKRENEGGREEEEKKEEGPFDSFEEKEEPGQGFLDGEYALVQVLEDIPEFAGVDRNYHLRKGDVVTLPKDVASIVCGHGKCKILELSC